MRLGCSQVVPGDPDETTEPLVSRREKHFDRPASGLQFVEVGDCVQLVEIEALASKAPEELLELGGNAGRILALCLAGYEQAVARAATNGPSNSSALP